MKIQKAVDGRALGRALAHASVPPASCCAKASMAALSPDTRKRPTGPAAVSAKEQLGGAKSPRLADSGSDGVVERTLGRQAGAS